MFSIVKIIGPKNIGTTYSPATRGFYQECRWVVPTGKQEQQSFLKANLIKYCGPSIVSKKFISDDKPSYQDEKRSNKFGKELNSIVKTGAFIMMGIPLFIIGGFATTIIFTGIGFWTTELLMILIEGKCLNIFDLKEIKRVHWEHRLMGQEFLPADGGWSMWSQCGIRLCYSSH